MTEALRITLSVATIDDVQGIFELRAEVGESLTQRHGRGHWSSFGTENGVRRELATGGLFVARHGGQVVAALTLSLRKPWAIDREYFTEASAPLYLTNMAVRPAMQRLGLGRQCVEQVCGIAREKRSDAIRLDAYAAAAGAGEFYRRCGFAECGHVVYRGTPLRYFEMML